MGAVLRRIVVALSPRTYALRCATDLLPDRRHLRIHRVSRLVDAKALAPSIRSRISKFEWRITILNSTSAVWEIEMNYRSGGIGIIGVIVIVLVILWLVGVIKL
jgi:hypothetical protein